jgi:hypothetical protein
MRDIDRLKLALGDRQRELASQPSMVREFERTSKEQLTSSLKHMEYLKEMQLQR